VQEAPETESANGGTVLLVEDNPDVAEVNVAMLEELGYRVRTVGDAAAALEAIGEETFDLVVSDIIMAGPMDGLALARTLRERQPGLPVLLVTGYSHAASGAGADFIVLRKPFKLAELSRIAARMIAESKQPAITNLVRLRDVRLGGGLRSKPR
jgi:CheY-like chemotaxis protein